MSPIARAQSASAVTSSRQASAVPPASAMLRQVWAEPASSMSATTTLAPSRARAAAVARPIPLAAPLMIATLPSSLPIFGPLVSTPASGLHGGRYVHRETLDRLRVAEGFGRGGLVHGRAKLIPRQAPQGLPSAAASYQSR